MHITCTGHRFHPGSEYQVASLTDRIPGQVSTGVGALFECLELDLPAAPSVCCNRPSDVCGVAGMLPERDRRCSRGGHPGWRDGGGFPGRTAHALGDGVPVDVGEVFYPVVRARRGEDYRVAVVFDPVHEAGCDTDRGTGVNQVGSLTYRGWFPALFLYTPPHLS